MRRMSAKAHVSQHEVVNTNRVPMRHHRHPHRDESTRTHHLCALLRQCAKAHLHSHDHLKQKTDPCSTPCRISTAFDEVCRRSYGHAGPRVSLSSLPKTKNKSWSGPYDAHASVKHIVSQKNDPGLEKNSLCLR